MLRFGRMRPPYAGVAIQFALLFLPFTLSQGEYVALFTNTPQTAVEQPLTEEERHQLEKKRIRAERTAALTTFFEQYQSPLTEDAETFVMVAEEYDLDWRLLPAIACKESTCGQYIPWNAAAGTPSYNPFGWGVYGDQVISFPDWADAIDTVGAGLRKHYYDNGRNTPELIEEIYTPSSLERGRTWSSGVRYFMAQIETEEEL